MAAKKRGRLPPLLLVGVALILLAAVALAVGCRAPTPAAKAVPSNTYSSQPTPTPTEYCIWADLPLTSLTIVLTGSVPSTYEVNLVTNSGESLEVRCPGEPIDPWFTCTESGVILHYRNEPAEATITVRWNGNSMTEKVRPSYYTEPSEKLGACWYLGCTTGEVTLQLPTPARSPTTAPQKE